MITKTDIDELTMLFPHDTTDQDVNKVLDGLSVIIERTTPGSPFGNLALLELIRVHTLAGEERQDTIDLVLGMLEQGERHCPNPCCPINFAIDVARAAVKAAITKQ